MKKYFNVAMLFAVLAMPALASVYTATISSAVSSYSLPASTSGMTDSYYAVRATSGGTLYVGKLTGSCTGAPFCFSIDGSHNLSISSFSAAIWPSGFTGTVQVKTGIGNVSDTSSNADLHADIDNGVGVNDRHIKVCQNCSTISYVKRTYGAAMLFMSTATVRPFTSGSPGSCNGTIKVYIRSLDGRLAFAHSAGSAACLTDVSGAVLGDYANDGVQLQLGTINQGLSNFLTELTDDRPWAP